MSELPSGWYEDPQDPSKLRYWDGILWTDRVMPKVRPNLHKPDERTSPQPPAGYPHRFDPYQRGRQSGYSPRTAAMPAPARTPDGELLSGWWRRVAAFIVDNILVFVVSGAITWPWLSGWVQAYADYASQVSQAASGGGSAPAMPAAVLAFPWQTMLVNLVLYAVYEIVLVAYRGQTVGKMLVRIRIRRAEGGGNPTVPESAIRFVLKQLSVVLGAIPVLSTLAVIFNVVDYLTPLFHRFKRAIHDRAAQTYVVRTASGSPGRGRPGSR